MIGEEGKATGPLTDLLDHHLEAMMAADVLLHEIDLALEPIPGYHRIEVFHDHEVARL